MVHSARWVVGEKRREGDDFNPSFQSSPKVIVKRMVYEHQHIHDMNIVFQNYVQSFKNMAKFFGGEFSNLVQ